MKSKIIIIKFLFLLILSSCKTIENKEPVIHQLTILNKDLGGISINYFKENYLVNKTNRLSKKDFIYDTIQDEMRYTKKNIPVKLTTLVNYFSKKELYDEEVVIKDGYPIDLYKANIFVKEKGNVLIKTIEYNREGVLGKLKANNSNDSILYQTTFKKGTGYWKDYYYKESKLREEGKVKKNYKEGVWKYYNLSGGIDSTKRYILKDAVDVRFPYCLFNKKEPCY